MADIRKLRAIRPAKEKAEKIAALPYDVYNREEAKREVGKNPLSFLSIDRAETSFPDSVDTYADCVYEKAGELIKEGLNNGNFVQDETPLFYLYALTMDGRVQHGIVACASIDDYEKGIIKKHENTRADKEADRIRHVETCNMQTGPIFLAYRENPVLKEVIRKVVQTPAEADFVSEDGIRHQVWCITEPELQNCIQDTFADGMEVYIADGHHRCASAVKVGQKRRKENPGYTGEEEFNYFLSVLFSEDELLILDYNRVIKDRNGHTTKELLELFSKDFQVEKIERRERKPEKKGEFFFYDGKDGGSWYRLETKEQCFTGDPVEDLDVSVLQKRILEPFFGIQDPKTDKRIDFVGGIRGLKELEKRCREDAEVAFALYPTSIQELFGVADAGLLMPPKSTWFEPKLRSGLFLHPLE